MQNKQKPQFQIDLQQQNGQTNDKKQQFLQKSLKKAWNSRFGSSFPKIQQILKNSQEVVDLNSINKFQSQAIQVKCMNCQHYWPVSSRNSAKICKKCNISNQKNKKQTDATANKKFKTIKESDFLQLIKMKKVKSKQTALQLSEIQQNSTRASQQFLKEYPELCQNNFIQFPVEDSLFYDQTLGLEPLILSQTSLPPHPLPLEFSYFLQLWNLITTFYSYFETPHNTNSLTQLQNFLSNDQSLKLIITKIIDLFIQQFSSQKNSISKKSKNIDLLHAIKFCCENSLKQKLYKGCWPIIILNIRQFLCYQKQDQQADQFRNIVLNCLIKLNRQTSVKLIRKIKILAILSRQLVELSQFKKLIQEKVKREKKQHKLIFQLKSQRLKLQKQLLRTEDEQKECAKKTLIIDKHITTAENNQNIDILKSDKTEFYRTQKAELLYKISQIDDQMDFIQKQSVHLSYVQLIGKDKDKNLFWKVLTQPGKIFVNRQEKWGYYIFEQIEPLSRTLNLRGIRQNDLFKALKNYKQQIQQNKLKLVHDMLQFQTLEYDQQDQITIWQENLDEKLIQQIKVLLTESEFLFAKYLQQRNSRWARPKQRQQYLQQISKINELKFKQTLDLVKNFNEKICVVQTQYRIIDQESQIQIDKKTRKVQTKIWGISQKYKNHWIQMCQDCKNFTDLYFAVYVLFINIQKYTSKSRLKRKEFQIVKELNKYIKTVSCRKQQLSWQQHCDICQDGGQLLCCDMCIKVYHIQCLDLPTTPTQIFQCSGCKIGEINKKSLRSNKK